MGLVIMCGIFGFVMKQPIKMSRVFKILHKLEVSQYPNESLPVGGYGAGVAVLLKTGSIWSEKVGKTSPESPTMQLAEITREAKVTDASVLLGHVRFPNPEFMNTVKLRESAQPYIGGFERGRTIVSVHNGKIENFKEIKEKLKAHTFESEKAGLIDSEIVPHYFSELLNESETTNEALYELLYNLGGSSSIAMLHLDEENAFLHLIYKGKARGITVWANSKNEVVFCSRPEPVQTELEGILAKREFKEKISIKWFEDAGLKLSFPAVFP